jgi:hypothetical protein
MRNNPTLVFSIGFMLGGIIGYILRKHVGAKIAIVVSKIWELQASLRKK